MRSKSLVLVVLLAACGSTVKLPEAGPAPTAATSETQALLDKADGLWKSMKDKADIEPTLHAYEDVLRAAPNDPAALLRAAQLYDRFGINVAPDKETQMKVFLQGREAALKALGQNAEFRTKYEKDQDIVEAVKVLKAADAPAAYWAAVTWAHWGERYGITAAAFDIPKVKAMIDKVLELDPTYLGNAADRFFIGYWVKIPGMMGKDPTKSKAAYERAIKASPSYLDNYVVYAQYYCVDAEDAALFEKSLKVVLDAPADADGAADHLDNNLARMNAKSWLDKKSELFD